MSTPSWLYGLEAFAEQERVAGELVLTSGAIVACDPLVNLDGTKAFETKVEPGPYPVLLGVLQGDVAWARVEFRGDEVTRWVRAGSHGVDSGTSCFVDAQARDVEVARQKARRNKIFAAVVAGGVDPADGDAWDAACAEERKKLGSDPLLERVRSGLVEIGEATLVAFTSGAGDGSYTTWWGLDAQGAPITLVSDFALLEDDEEDFDEPSVQVVDQRQGPAPAFVRALAFIKRLEQDGLLEVEAGTSRDVLAEGILLAWDASEPDVGWIAAQLFELDGVEELYASDEELKERL